MTMTYAELQKLTQDGQLVNPDFVLVDDNAAGLILNIKPDTLAVWRSSGRYNLPFIKIGRRIRYRLSDLTKFIDARSATTTLYGKMGGGNDND